MKRFKKGFTLAEVLITLSIIGIIAAIVMPSVIASYQYKTIGVKLSKFMAATEQASRAYVVSNSTFRNDTIRGQRQILGFMNDSFLISDIVNSPANAQAAYLNIGNNDLTAAQRHSVFAITLNENNGQAAEVNTTQGGALTYSALNRTLADNVAQAGADLPMYAVLKDGTQLAMQFVQTTPADNSYEDHQAAVDSAKVGLPVFDLIFSPNVSGLPATAQKTFHFTVTEMGYLVPNDKDGCLWTMYNNEWQSTAQTFAEGGVCNNDGEGGVDPAVADNVPPAQGGN